jgi:glucose uptake protein GlcU
MAGFFNLLMRFVGWVILIPAAIGLFVSGLFTIYATITFDVANFFIWSIISAVLSGVGAVGMLMAGIMKDDE